MTAKLTHDHPTLGVRTRPVSDYHVTPPGVLIAELVDGGRLVLSPASEWHIDDAGDG